MTAAPPVPGSANPALVPQQPPYVPHPAAPVDPWPPGFLPGDNGPHQGDPGIAPAPGPAPAAPATPPGALPAEVAPAAYGGNVGPVGSVQERSQLSYITGQPATTATQLLMGPVVRGMTVGPGQGA